MISRSKLALRAALSAGLSLFAATPAQANAATAVSIPGRMYSVGCMSASSCVTAGFSSGQGPPTEIDIVHGRTVVRTVRPKGTSSGNLTDVTCPSRAECIVVAPGAPGRTDIVTVSSAAAVTIRTVTAAAGTTYDSISCLSARSCELSGWSTDNSPIVVASWNGRRITATHFISIPNGASMGNYVPSVSCSSAWCEVTDSLLPPDAQNNDQEPFLTVLHDGMPVSAHFLPGYRYVGVSCSTATTCWALLDSDTPSGYAATSFLAPVMGGAFGMLHPIPSASSEFTCVGNRCLVATGTTIATYASGRVAGSTMVPGVQSLLGLTAIPGLGYAAVGPRYRRPGSFLVRG